MKAALLACFASVAAAGDDWNSTLVKEGLKLYATEVHDQEDVECELHGSLPEWLKGTFYRNGPGKFDVSPGGQHVVSAFDGYAYVNRFKVDGKSKKVIFSGRFLETGRYRQLKKRGDMSYQGLLMKGTVPERKEHPAYIDKYGVDMGGQININFMKIGDKNHSNEHLLGLGEMPYGTEFNPDTLQTVLGTDKGSYFKFDDKISDVGMGNAHPWKLANGDIVGKTTGIPFSKVGARTDYNIFKIKAGTTSRELLATYSKWSMDMTYSHSFGVESDRYVILPFWPLAASKFQALTAINLFPSMSMGHELTKMVVLDLKTGNATEFTTNEMFFGFHFFNVFVDTSSGKQELVADLTTQTDVNLFDQMDVDMLRAGTNIDKSDIAGYVKRIRIPLWSEVQETPVSTEHPFSTHPVSGKMQGHNVAKELAKVTTLSLTRIEVPKINEAYLFKNSYKFVYGWYATRVGNIPNAIAKVNVADGSSVIWTEPNNRYGITVGESIFVPSPESKAEDDGVLVASALHIQSKRAFFLVLNATTMTEIARAYTKQHLTFGAHALWLPSEDATEVVV